MFRPVLSYMQAAIVVLSLACGLSGCATPTTRHPIAISDLGVSSRTSDMEASLARPGIVTFQRIGFARWTGGRGTFIDRKDARTADVPKGDEEATIYAYVIDHPGFGRVLIDSGISDQLDGRLSLVMRRGVHDLDIRTDQTLGRWLAGQTPPKAVFLTHLHFDHIGGLIDVPVTTPLYVGAGDAEERNAANLVLGHPADAILRGFGPLQEWAFQRDPDGAFDGVVDVFGDGSVWAVRVPGHSAGSTAYLINAIDGPKLVVGDAISTRLGWVSGMPQPLAPEARANAESSADRRPDGYVHHRRRAARGGLRRLDLL